MRKIALFIFFFFCLLSVASAQSKQLEKATKLFNEKRYAEAAEYYEEVLKEKENISVKTKLAYCYRVNNKLDEAEKLYAEIVSSEKAKAKTYFYYGETLMGNGKYDEAKKWFKEYEILEPEDENARLMLEACDLVKTIEPYFQKIKTSEFPFNSDADDSSPVMFGDNLVFSSDRSSGIASQKSGWTGRSYINLFFSTQIDTSFTEPKVFSGKLSESNKNTGNPSFTEDGSEIFFTRNGVELSNRSTYNLSLFSAEGTGDLKWKNVKSLPFSSKEYNYMHPAISPDGKYLFFVSDKPKGYGGTDIWVTKRTKDGWGRTQNLGANVNTVANEGFPFVGKDGKLYFCSKGHPGFGGFDIFVTEKDANGEWGVPINLGSPINSPQDDISISLSKDKTKGLFTSNRSGGDDDIYLFEIIKGSSDQKQIVSKEEAPVAIPVKKVIEVSKENIVIEEINTEIPVIETVKEEGISIEPSTETAVNIEEEKAQEVIEAKEITLQEETTLISETPQTPSYEVQEEEILETIVPETPALSEVATEEVETIADSLTQIDLSTEKVLVSPNNVENEEETQTEESSILDFYYFKEAKMLQETKGLKGGEIFRLEDIYYDFEVYQVTSEVKEELDKVVIFLQENKEIQIELGAHTESPGNDQNNLILSRYRAEAAVAYLEKQGIEKERLTAKGYGETQILNQCVNEVECSAEDHAFNQRLEVKVLAE